ncbi:MAG: OBAP family protein [Burkholderiaceae bacterium]
MTDAAVPLPPAAPGRCRGGPAPCLVAALALLCAPVAGAGSDTPPGRDKGLETKALEAGARLLQRDAPPSALDIHLDGFHAAKDDPSHQMQAHHFCRQVNEDFAQCALYDGDAQDANLVGVEYIISDKLFDTLPPDERRYWHPHNYEILSGELVAPGLPAAAEKQLMKKKINSYGKTWHFWNTGPGGDRLPLGAPVLEWSFNRDGEMAPEMVRRRNEQYDASMADKRRERADLTPLAQPQAGVDALNGRFAGETRPIPGVVDRDAAPAR